MIDPGCEMELTHETEFACGSSCLHLRFLCAELSSCDFQPGAQQCINGGIRCSIAGQPLTSLYLSEVVPFALASITLKGSGADANTSKPPFDFRVHEQMASFWARLGLGNGILTCDPEASKRS
eukprot:s3967_g2.t1